MQKTLTFIDSFNSLPLESGDYLCLVLWLHEDRPRYCIMEFNHRYKAFAQAELTQSIFWAMRVPIGYEPKSKKIK